MKKLILVAALFFSQPAVAADLEAVALERLSFEISSAQTPASKADSVANYINSLDRLGAAPNSADACLNSALAGTVSASCLSLKLEANLSGAGTGGAD